MGLITTDWWTAASKGQALMPHEIAVGAAGGSFSALLLAFIRELATRDTLPEIPPCLCPDSEYFQELLDHPQIIWLLVGILIGSLSGVILDLILVIRARWRRFVAAQLAPQETSARSLYKIVHE